MNAREYQAIKERVEDLQRKIAKTEGQLQEAMQALIDDYDVDDEAKVKALIEQMTQEEFELGKEIDKLEKAFDKKWKDVLEDLE